MLFRSLDRPDIRSFFKQMGCKTMAKRMSRDFFLIPLCLTASRLLNQAMLDLLKQPKLYGISTFWENNDASLWNLTNWLTPSAKRGHTAELHSDQPDFSSYGWSDLTLVASSCQQTPGIFVYSHCPFNTRATIQIFMDRFILHHREKYLNRI